MEKLWHVQRLEDGTYGDWREFKDNKEGVISMGDKVIGWDYGTDDYNCMVFGHYNKKGELVIDKVDYDKNGKEVKKMSRPYFETQIVKVKKEKCEHSHLIQVQDMPYRLYQCANCGYYIYPPLKNDCLLVKGRVYKQQKKGNYINGENLDKIKFPCFCSYRYESKIHYGIITRTRLNLDRDHYTLHSIEKQHGSYSSVHSYITLKYMIKCFDIHILKGKIEIYEEE